jgi:FtsZ-binding cell division protein ZapB
MVTAHNSVKFQVHTSAVSLLPYLRMSHYPPLLKLGVEENQSRLVALEKAHADRQEENQSRLVALEKAHANQQEENQSRLVALEKSLKQLEKSNKQETAKLGKYKSEVGTLKTELDDVKRLNKSLTTELDEVKRSNESLTTELDEVKRSHNSLKTECTGLSGENRLLHERIRTVENTQEHLLFKRVRLMVDLFL